jgi:hypothetical protein
MTATPRPAPMMRRCTPCSTPSQAQTSARHLTLEQVGDVRMCLSTRGEACHSTDGTN